MEHTQHTDTQNLRQLITCTHTHTPPSLLVCCQRTSRSPSWCWSKRTPQGSERYPDGHLTNASLAPQRKFCFHRQLTLTQWRTPRSKPHKIQSKWLVHQGDKVECLSPNQTNNVVIDHFWLDTMTSDLTNNPTIYHSNLSIFPPNKKTRHLLTLPYHKPAMFIHQCSFHELTTSTWHAFV